MEATGLITDHLDSENAFAYRLIHIPTLEQVEAWELEFPGLYTNQMREVAPAFQGETKLRAFFIGFFGHPKVKYSFGLKVNDFTQLVGRLSDVITNHNAVRLLISYPRFLYDRAIRIEEQHREEEQTDVLLCLGTQQSVFDNYEYYVRTTILP